MIRVSVFGRVVEIPPGPTMNRVPLRVRWLPGETMGGDDAEPFAKGRLGLFAPVAESEIQPLADS